MRFKPQDLDNIQATPGLFATAPASFLTKLFEDWVQKRLYYTLPPTVGAIETALRSRTVELGLEADEIENYMQSSPSSKDKPTTDTMPVMSGRSFVCFSLIFDDTTEGNVEVHCTTNIRKNLNVGENRSVLLEVNSNIKGLILGYQWLANRKVLHDNKNFSGCESSIMCITKADLTMDGVQISCEVKAKCLEHTVKTSSVTLKVDSKLDNYFGILARLYLLRPEVPEDVWPPVSSKKFINLALIKQQHINCGANNFAHYTIRGDMDDILKHKEVIEFEEIVKDLTVGQSLFIEGHPGSGKTTFVNKITQHWALSPDGAIRIMLLVSLRVLNTLNKCNLDLSDILKLFHDLKGSKDLIEARNGEGVCFIFDGLDEFSPQDGKKSLVYKIINKEYLDRSTVIVASRPAAIAKLRSKADKVIEVLGFRKEQIIEYFYHYPFSDDLKPEELEAYLSVHHNILHMCYLPIHAAMVAFVFQVNGEVPQTETEIYTHFTRFTIMRSLSKTREVVLDDIDMYDLEEEDERYLGQICKLALEMTILNKQVLHQEEAMQFFKKQKGGDISLGLITIDRVAGLYGFKDIYTFLHLTFQEYLAACHVLTLGNDEQESLIQEHGGKNHMLMVWKFYCGLLRSGLGRKIVSIVQQTSGKFLFHSQCAYESQDKRACDYVLQSSGGVVRIENQCLKTPDLTAISFVSVKPLIPVDITLAYCNIDIDPINSEYIPNILRLFLFQLDITSYAFENLLRFCSNSNIQKLKIIDTLTGLKDAEVLAFYIRNYTNLKELDISNNAMGDTGMIAVASNLCKCINLEKLVLSENQLTAASGVFKKVFATSETTILR